jgi:hypothetical protein
VRYLRSQRSVAWLAELVDLYSQGKLRTYPRPRNLLAGPGRRCPPEVETGHGRGKVVLSVD